MKEFVKDIKQVEAGVDIELGGAVERAKCDALAAKCGPGGGGCDSECCDETQGNVHGIDVDGVDGDVTMHLKTSLSAGTIANAMSKCNCYNDV